MIDVIPGILEEDFPEIKKKIKLVEPYVSWVQIDILDGTLFNNSCFHEAQPFSDLDTHLLLEAHLMVKNPIRYIEPFFAAGFQRFIAHIEGFDEGQDKENMYDFINTCHTFGAEIGVAVDLPTAVDYVFPYLESIDQVLVMTINAGKSGQSFEGEALDKIRTIRDEDPHMHVEVDGGITPDTAKLAVEAGATRLSANSAIFQSDNIKEAIEALKASGSV